MTDTTDDPRPPDGPASVLPSRFDARAIEARWQAEWERHELFRAPDRPKGPVFTVPLPPPNVTGILTIGHMLGDTVMDVLVRHHRMRGKATLWVPGVDHAGLATQVEVRRRLQKQGVAIESLPREELLRHLEAWATDHEARIRQQMRAGGFSVDWSRFRYTKDPRAVRATREAFVRLFEAGLVYRGERMVNWDPRLRTAVSDLEVIHREEETTLYYLRYPWADGSPGGLEIATVRPETIFGDVAVAVHPEDERHREQVGRSVLVPLIQRDVPVIADAAVDPTFGAGALKITPRHDIIDYEIFGRHPELAMPQEILDPGGKMTGEAIPPELRGLGPAEARRWTVEALERERHVIRREPFRHSIGRSERSDAAIEPRLSLQWFVRMKPLAEPALDAVRDGRIRIHPDRWVPTFFRWMEGIQDWCISRQVAWGHPIPVYRCGACAREFASVEEPTACPGCHGREFEPDPDVLDTWFTSWMWPFLSLGWPEPTADLAHYYPTSVLVTGRDIMFFWVARMMMAGFYLTGRPPFSDVAFTGMLRDPEGRRMSKHLGNSPDPLAVIEKWGADAMRWAVVFPGPASEDGPFGEPSLEGARNFLTKVWNLGRFTLANLPPGTPAPARAPTPIPASPLEDRWILSRYHRSVEAIDRALATFEITAAASDLHQFIWHDLADRYVEIAKSRLSGHEGSVLQREARATLLFVMERSLRMLHPFAPHVTEELWHALPHAGEHLARASWPAAGEVPLAEGAETEMEMVFETIRLLRNLRAEEHVPSETVPEAWVRARTDPVSRLLQSHTATIERLARVRPLSFLSPEQAPPAGSESRVAPFGECFLIRPAGHQEESASLQREREKLETLLERSRLRLEDPGFRDRAPPEVVRELEEKATELSQRIARIDAHLSAGASS